MMDLRFTGNPRLDELHAISAIEELFDLVTERLKDIPGFTNLRHDEIVEAAEAFELFRKDYQPSRRGWEEDIAKEYGQ